MKIQRKVPKCCGKEIDLVVVRGKDLFFQCKICGKVIVIKEDLRENNEK